MHFCIGVMIEKSVLQQNPLTPKYIESLLEPRLAPFDENGGTQVPGEYNCFCAEGAMYKRVSSAKDGKDAEMPGKTLKVLYTERNQAWFKADKAAAEALEPEIAKREDALLIFEREWRKANAHLNVPDPECTSCKGTGKYRDDEDDEDEVEEFTRNPQGYWDWWQLGGRYSGLATGVDPEAKPENREPCSWCYQAPPGGVCPHCKGKGELPKWPTQWVPGQEWCDVLDAQKRNLRVYGFLTKNGEWLSRDQKIEGTELTSVEWDAKTKEVYANHQDCIMAIVDCHV